MSTPPESGSGSGIIVQAPTNVPLPTYDWNAPDQMQEFQLFKHQFTSWEKIYQIMSNEVNYLLSILGEEGYAPMDHWMPTDPTEKNDSRKFLKYLESTLDDEISPCVRVYEVEDVKKRTDETIDGLIDCICQLACHALIGDGSDAPVKFQVQCRLIHVIPDGDIEIQKELLKVSWDKGVSHLLEICCTYYAIESGASAICAVKTINAVQKSHWPWKQPQKHPSQYQNCTCQHPPGCDNCPAQESICRGCSKQGHWQAKCHSSKKNQSTAPVDSQSKGMPDQHAKKGKKADLIEVHTEEPPCNEIFLNNVHALHTNEAYTTVLLPASASNKGMASLWVKFDTGASENVLLLHLFRHLYPDHIEKTGDTSGLNVSNTRLTAYNGIWIPLFGSLHGPIIWQPSSPCAQPQQINPCWYVSDIPGPAILGLPSCQILEVVKMNCAVKVIQYTSHLPGPTPAPATPTKTAPIKSTEDLIRKFPDRF